MTPIKKNSIAFIEQRDIFSADFSSGGTYIFTSIWCAISLVGQLEIIFIREKQYVGI